MSISNTLSVNIPFYSYGSVCALDSLNISIPCGQLTAIIGPNGGGKSTLLKLISGIYPLQKGSISFPKTYPGHLAYLQQTAVFDRTFPLRVEDVVAMGLWSKIGMFGRLPCHLKPKITGILSQVGLSGYENRSLTALSGGQLQRLLFARLIAQDADIILLDEPFAAIDPATTQDLVSLLHAWNAEGKTILTVLHDLNLVKQHFSSTLLLARSIISYGQTKDVLTAENLAKAVFNV